MASNGESFDRAECKETLMSGVWTFFVAPCFNLNDLASLFSGRLPRKKIIPSLFEVFQGISPLKVPSAAKSWRKLEANPLFSLRRWDEWQQSPINPMRPHEKRCR